MKSVLLFVLLVFTLSVFPQNIKKVKLFINNETDIQKVVSLQLDLEHSIVDKEGNVSLFVDEKEFQNLIQSNLSYEILIDDWKQYYNSLPVPTEIEKQIIKSESENLFGVTGFDFGSMGGYYTLAEIEADLDEMFQLYPNLITQKYSIGTSVEGRTIWAVKISDNPNINENEPSVGFDALVHAREPQSMATQMYFMWYLLENYGTDPTVTYLVDNREIYCVPCFNPDGYEYNRQTDPNGGGWWRKNRRDNGGSCYGVDLNRNFGYMWGYDNIGSSPDPCDNTYRGSSAFSEPEAQAIRDLAILKNYGTHFNMHSYGNYYLYPWGYIDQQTPDSSTYREFASDMGNLSGYAYGTGPQLLGYPSNGSVRDWMYGEQTDKNKIFGYTIEIGPEFWPNQNQIFPIAQQNVLSNMYHAFVAGEYVQLVNPNFDREYFIPADAVELTPEFKNKGLATAYNLTFELSSPSQYITINSGNASLDSLEARTASTLTTPFSFVISISAPLEEEIPIVLTTRVNGDIVASDTTTIIIGFPVFIFEDLANDPAVNWTITASPSSPKWDETIEAFYSAPNSYTDSKNQNYRNNATVTMTLTSALNLSGYTNPRLRFYTQFNIESNWDYGWVRVSTNNGSSWTALEGYYTEPGEGSFQPNGQPVYDGVISDWVKEEISLASHVSSQLKLQFQLRTDGGVTRDGWFIDDIGIFIYTIPTDNSSNDGQVYTFSLDQNFPNPFNPTTKINYTIPSAGTSSMKLVLLKVYDVLGNEIAVLVNKEQVAGNYEVEFDATNLSSGTYFYKLVSGSFVETKKMLLIK
ncbi:MAG: T9SS type A sorting domain-containing protein [Ignavibacteriaceae bacterium]|nr:immune inhibitor A [Ignavibacteria bacterium]MBT8391967.1 immune inhibitor A [Ignavibacteria bacterium]NNJ53173.1 T9SS type A sorting domain-containing protein [Ignavibacteriaceae bacterium]